MLLVEVVEVEVVLSGVLVVSVAVSVAVLSAGRSAGARDPQR